MNSLIRSFVNILIIFIVAGFLCFCGNNSGDTSTSQSLEVNLANNTIQANPSNILTPIGVLQQFNATEILSNSGKIDRTKNANWTTSDSTIATINSQGILTPKAAGKVTITATYNGLTGSMEINVIAASLQSISIGLSNTINGNSMVVNSSQQLYATGIYSNGNKYDLTLTATWASSNPSFASVSGGLVKALSTGKTTITATVPSILTKSKNKFNATNEASIIINVTSAQISQIQVTPTNPTIHFGTNTQLTATAILSDSTKQDITNSVTWSTSSSTISNSGLFNASNIGTAIVTASLNGVIGSNAVTVLNSTLISIQVASAKSSISTLNTLQFTALGVYSDGSSQDLTNSVFWSVSSPIASIGNTFNNSGLLLPSSKGTINVTATIGSINGSSQLTITNVTLQSISVTTTSSSIPNGLSSQFIAIGTYSDGSTQNISTQAIWTSSATNIATMSNSEINSGLASAISVGSTTITATLSGISGSAPLTVTSVVLLGIQVTPINSSVAKGLSQQFSAIATYSDGTTQDLTSIVTWSSSNVLVATINNTFGSSGLATTLSVGTSTITAALGSSLYTSTLTVTVASLQSIQVAPAGTSISVGNTRQFTATGVYSDSSTQDITGLVTWASSSTSKVTINSSGLATGIAPGIITIIATLDNVSGNVTLGVNNANLYVANLSANSVSYCPISSNGALETCTITGNNANSPSDITGYNGYVYIVNNGTANILYCPINVNGSLGICSITATGFSSPFKIVIQNNYAYIADNGNNSVWYCPVNANGTLGACGIAASGLTGTFAIAINSMYAYITSISLSTVYYCPLNANGTFGTCNTTGNGFNGSRGIAINNGYAYVTNFSGNSVSYCPINANGTFGTCNTTGSGFASPQGITITFGGYVYTANMNSATVIFTTINANGTLGTGTTTGNGFSAYGVGAY